MLQPRPKGDGDFVRLKDGDTVTGVFRGDARQFYSRWTGKQSEEVGPGQGGRFRFRLNFVAKEKVEGEWSVLLFEQGAKFYDELLWLDAKLTKAGKKLSETWVEISRTGSGIDDTVYRLSSEGPVDADTLGSLDAVKLNPLVLEKKEEAQDEIPF
jgi:hypothetical protein